jgi:hypothetical protein
VSYLRIPPSLFARFVRAVLKLMRSKREFAAKIAPQDNTSMLKDGSAKSALLASMSMRTQGDVECALNIALVAIKIRLQRNWNALSAILPHSLIRIQNCVSLNASLPATNTTLRPSRAVNALRTSLIQQEQRSASLATAIIVWIASILFSIRPFPNVSNVIVQRRWTINR